MDDLYRENILDHYKHPRNAGTSRTPTVSAEGVNPLCGDELQVELQIEDGVSRPSLQRTRLCHQPGRRVDDLRVAKGRSVDEVRALGQEDVLDELGIPLSPIRLKCALLSVKLLGSRSVTSLPRTTRSRGTPGRPPDEIPEGGVKIVQSGSLFIGVYRIDGQLYALEDRCSHDDGPLCEGEREGYEVICPRHGARFDLRTGAYCRFRRPRTSRRSRSWSATASCSSPSERRRRSSIVGAMSATLSEATQEYLEIIYWLYEAGIDRTQANLARALQVSQPSASEMVKRLADEGLIGATTRS